MSEWQKVKIGEVMKRIKRPVVVESDKEYKLVTVKLHHKGISLREYRKGYDIGSKMYGVKSGDFILSGIDARNGAFGIVGDELDGAIVTNDFWYFELNEKLIDKHFFLELTSLKWFDEICRLGSDGTTQRIRLQKDRFFNQDIYLPTIEKQKKLSKMLFLIKGKKAILDEKIADQNNYLANLRQQILQDAISGKLTADWRAKNLDIEPALKLLEKIKAEKERLIQNKLLKKSGDIKNIKTLRSLNIPDNWTWTKADQIFFVTKLAGFEYTKYMHLKDQGEIPVIRAQNVRPMIIKKDSLKYIDLKTSNQLERCALIKPCLLVTFIGAGIGDVAFFQEKERWHLAPNVAKMEPFQNCEELINLKFLIYFLFSSTGQKELFKHVKATAQPSLSMGTIRDIDFPFPPIAEQKAIVAKVEKLMEHVSKLEEKINQNKQDAEMLMQSFLVEAFKN